MIQNLDKLFKQNQRELETQLQNVLNTLRKIEKWTKKIQERIESNLQKLDQVKTTPKNNLFDNGKVDSTDKKFEKILQTGIEIMLKEGLAKSIDEIINFNSIDRKKNQEFIDDELRNKSLKIASNNIGGINNNSGYLNTLVLTHNVVCIQETWATNNPAEKVNGKRPPSGGLAFIVVNNIICDVKFINNRIGYIKFGDIMVFNLYLPYFNGQTELNLEFDILIEQLQDFIQRKQPQNVDYTYKKISNKKINKSWIDHVACYQEKLNQVKTKILYSDSNLSEHNALSTSIENIGDIINEFQNTKVERPKMNWLNLAHRLKYQDILEKKKNLGNITKNLCHIQNKNELKIKLTETITQLSSIMINSAKQVTRVNEMSKAKKKKIGCMKFKNGGMEIYKS
ncbi:unnamed protein product [Brachionus calyciflorus]|uniref:Uncharacterized protein n=1 Tax=Brachionus calyciflorus TaxID=104777 RepID=A0A813Q9S1_9BILA|nr:unnamed protein product [Brachionus calyciflorus]